MVFDEKKLEVGSIDDLFQCRIETVEPYALMLAPVYVYMKLNEKLVSVKAPLDFFTPEELDRLKRYEVFYIPKFIQSATRFQTSAKIVLGIAQAAQQSSSLAPAPFEISNEVIQVVAPLWGANIRVESFFSAVFADELCGPLDSILMIHAREKTVERHDAGILLSGLLTFILVHLGWADPINLQQVRKQAYLDVVHHDEYWTSPRNEWEVVARDLRALLVRQNYINMISLASIQSDWSQKLLGRLQRVQGIRSVRNYASLSIYDEGGFAS